MNSTRSIHTEDPGPGSYEATSFIDSKGAITLKASRFSSCPNIAPGPGRYNPQPHISSGVSFSQSPRPSLFPVTCNPGPCTYLIPSLSNGPSFTFQHKRSSLSTTTPGPGSHSPRFLLKTSSAHSIGSSKRQSLSMILDTPGPGCYEPKLSYKAPSYTFRKVRHSSITETPGPGKYDLTRPCVTSRIIPKAVKPELFKQELGPGPGDYETNESSLSKVKFSIGKAKRPKALSDTPGPGRYQLKAKSSAGVKFSKQEKNTLIVCSETPAANAYNPLLSYKAPSFTFTKQVEKKKPSSRTGPGCYNTDKKDRQPNIKFCKTMRFIKTCAEKEVLLTPGPGNYEIKSQNFKGNAFISKTKR